MVAMLVPRDSSHSRDALSSSKVVCIRATFLIREWVGLGRASARSTTRAWAVPRAGESAERCFWCRQRALGARIRPALDQVTY